MKIEYIVIILFIFGFPPGSYSLENFELAQERTNSFEPPRPITPREYEFPEPEIPLEPKKPIIETPSVSPPSSPDLPDIPGKIMVEEFKFIGNTAFNTETLAELLISFTKKEISFAELISVEQLI